jgi:hypothetical protein
MKASVGKQILACAAAALLGCQRSALPANVAQRTRPADTASILG